MNIYSPAASVGTVARSDQHDEIRAAAQRNCPCRSEGEGWGFAQVLQGRTLSSGPGLLLRGLLIGSKIFFETSGLICCLVMTNIKSPNVVLGQTLITLFLLPGSQQIVQHFESPRSKKSILKERKKKEHSICKSASRWTTLQPLSLPGLYHQYSGSSRILLPARTENRVWW